MIGALAFAALAWSSPQGTALQDAPRAETPSVSRAARFFPLNPGDEWDYDEVMARFKSEFTDSVGQPIEIAGQKAFPIRTKRNGALVGTAYYRHEGDSVLIVAGDDQKPFDPYPILKVGPSGRATWSHNGVVPFQGDPVPLSVRGSSKPAGQRTVNGERVETIEVTLDAVVGDPGLEIRTRQIAIYAAGIGLVESREERIIARNKTEQTRKLVTYRKAGK